MIRSRVLALVSRRNLSFAFVVLVVVTLVAVLVYGIANKGTQAGPRLAGKPAPDFTLNLFDGGSITLSQLRGRPVVLNFWASWCDSCREEAAVLEGAWREYKEKDVVFIGIAVRDSESGARQFIKDFNISYLNGPDSSNRVSLKYGVTGVPETVFVSREGLVVRKYVGPLNEWQIKRFIEELLR